MVLYDRLLTLRQVYSSQHFGIDGPKEVALVQVRVLGPDWLVVQRSELEHGSKSVKAVECVDEEEDVGVLEGALLLDDCLYAVVYGLLHG